ncbi:hypothetical protein Bca4012_086304 [Brassica carinata]|uniref:(rape) hypothetical protein n=1 Tax=Brassica napus TaxID=3708 RepID=A0A816R2H2_BRANA|nr:unnamed protein product [Brassica napus]
MLEGAITSRKQNRPSIAGEEGENAGGRAGRIKPKPETKKSDGLSHSQDNI